MVTPEVAERVASLQLPKSVRVILGDITPAFLPTVLKIYQIWHQFAVSPKTDQDKTIQKEQINRVSATVSSNPKLDDYLVEQVELLGNQFVSRGRAIQTAAFEDAQNEKELRLQRDRELGLVPARMVIHRKSGVTRQSFGRRVASVVSSSPVIEPTVEIEPIAEVLHQPEVSPPQPVDSLDILLKQVRQQFPPQSIEGGQYTTATIWPRVLRTVKLLVTLEASEVASLSQALMVSMDTKQVVIASNDRSLVWDLRESINTAIVAVTGRHAHRKIISLGLTEVGQNLG